MLVEIQLRATQGEVTDHRPAPPVPGLVHMPPGCNSTPTFITSGVLLTDEAISALLDAGIDHIQLRFQDSDPARSKRIGGYRGGHEKKLAAARRIKNAGLPLTTNFVIHRHNADRVDEMSAMGEALEFNIGPDAQIAANGPVRSDKKKRAES